MTDEIEETPFDRAFEKVLEFEGSYVNHAADPGGETKYGISKRSYPTLDIKNLTVAQAKAIYKKDFWDAMRCDELPPVLAETVFDAAVNSGRRAATIWLQKCMGVKADGIMGPLTIEAAHRHNPYRVAMRFYGERLALLTDLKHWSTFGRGWAKRIAAGLTDVY